KALHPTESDKAHAVLDRRDAVEAVGGVEKRLAGFELDLGLAVAPGEDEFAALVGLGPAQKGREREGGARSLDQSFVRVPTVFHTGLVARKPRPDQLFREGRRPEHGVFEKRTLDFRD